MYRLSIRKDDKDNLYKKELFVILSSVQSLQRKVKPTASDLIISVKDSEISYINEINMCLQFFVFMSL